MDAPKRPPVAAAPLSVILLAREPAELEAGLTGWRQYLESLQRPFEILLVRDDTIDPLPAAVDGDFPFARDVGFGPALALAIAGSQHPMLVTATADRQYVPSDLAPFLAVIDQVDLVIGFRAWKSVPGWRLFLDGILSILARILLGAAPEPRRGWLGRMGRGKRWVARWGFGLPAVDPECPFRLYRREVFHRIPIQSRGSFAFIEILAKANHLGFLMAEEPVAWTPPSSTHQEPASFLSEAAGLFRNPDFGPAQVPSCSPLPSGGEGTGVRGHAVR